MNTINDKKFQTRIFRKKLHHMFYLYIVSRKTALTFFRKNYVRKIALILFIVSGNYTMSSKREMVHEKNSLKLVAVNMGP